MAYTPKYASTYATDNKDLVTSYTTPKVTAEPVKTTTPVYTAPAPVAGYGEPAPVYTAPAPVYTAPAPVYSASAPAETFSVGSFDFDSQDQFTNYLNTTDAATVSANMYEYGVTDQDLVDAVNSLSGDNNYTIADAEAYRAGETINPGGGVAESTGGVVESTGGSTTDTSSSLAIGNSPTFTNEEFQSYIDTATADQILSDISSFGGTLDEFTNLFNSVYGTTYTGFDAAGLLGSGAPVPIGSAEFMNYDQLDYYLTNTAPAEVGQAILGITDGTEDQIQPILQQVVNAWNQLYPEGGVVTIEDANAYFFPVDEIEEPIIPEEIPDFEAIDSTYTNVSTTGTGGGVDYVAPTDPVDTTIPAVGYTPPDYVAPDPYEIPYEHTTAGQLEGLLSSGSPYMEQAYTSGLQYANSRGLLNSSLTAGWAQDAAIAAGLPIAQQDSQQYFDAGMAGYEGEIQGALYRQSGEISGELASQSGQIEGYLASLGGEISGALAVQDFFNSVGLINTEAGASSQLSTQEYLQNASLSGLEYDQSVALAAVNADYATALSELQGAQAESLAGLEYLNMQTLAELQAGWDADLANLQATWDAELSAQEFGQAGVLSEQDAQIALEYLEANGLIQIDLAEISAQASVTSSGLAANATTSAASINSAADLMQAELEGQYAAQYYLMSEIGDINSAFTTNYLAIQTDPDLDETAKGELLNGEGGLYDQLYTDTSLAASFYGINLTWDDAGNPVIG